MSVDFNPPRELAVIAAGFSGGGHERCAGTETAPKALMSAGLIDAIVDDEPPRQIHFDGDVMTRLKLDQLPETREAHRGVRNAHRVSGVSYALANQVAGHAGEGRQVLTLGGDHSTGVGSVAGHARAQRRKFQKELGVLWVDAHADINTPRSSPSGNAHGMPVAWLTGLAAEGQETQPFGWLEASDRVRPEKLVYVGTRAVDDAEREHVERLGIKSFAAEAVHRLGVKEVVRQALQHLGADKTPVHVVFDIDALDPSEAPSTSLPAPDGLTLAQAKELVELVRRNADFVGLDIVEVNPKVGSEEDVNRTLEAAKAIVESALILTKPAEL